MRAMKASGGGIEEAARILGITRQHMSKQLRQYDLYDLRTNTRGRKPRARKKKTSAKKDEGGTP